MQQTEVRIKVKAYYQLLQIEPEKLRLLSQFFRTFKSGLSKVYQAFSSCKKLKETSLSFLLRANAHKELQLW